MKKKKKGGECWSKRGSCTYRVPCATCVKCPWLRSDAGPVVVFLPWSWPLNAALWCEASGARAFTQIGYGHTARWSQETQQLCCCQNYGLLPGCPWSKLQQQRLPPPLGSTELPLCLKIESFPRSWCPRSRDMLWCRVSRARVFAQFRLGRAVRWS